MVVALAALSTQGGVGFWEVFLWPQLWLQFLVWTARCESISSLSRLLFNEYCSRSCAFTHLSVYLFVIDVSCNTSIRSIMVRGYIYSVILQPKLSVKSSNNNTADLVNLIPTLCDWLPPPDRGTCCSWWKTV